ncbi:hypothetical protein ABT187_01605 [Streptomyces sp. NPDC001817]|uniref:hypothetical protein n=1 Tax=Streptomyces sp. NPDC001817 TaxID=3154398 RepID=UPI003321064F
MPKAVARLVRCEVRLYASPVLWPARRTQGTGGGRGFGYMRGQATTMVGLAFV